ERSHADLLNPMMIILFSDSWNCIEEAQNVPIQVTHRRVDSIGDENPARRVLSQVFLGIILDMGDASAFTSGRVDPNPRQIILGIAFIIKFDNHIFHDRFNYSLMYFLTASSSPAFIRSNRSRADRPEVGVSRRARSCMTAISSGEGGADGWMNPKTVPSGR